MELPGLPISRPKTENVEEHKHPLLLKEDPDSDIDSHPRAYPSINQKTPHTSLPPGKPREPLNLKVLRHENQQLSTDVQLPRPPQTTHFGADMTSAQSHAPFRTIACPSCIIRPKRSLVQDQDHPLTLEDLDLNGYWPSTHSNYPAPTQEDRAELPVRRLALQKLRRKLREELPGFGRGGREEMKAVVKPYVPCEWHRRHPPSYWRPDLKALGLQFKHLDGSFHGGVSACCDWRRFRASVPNEMLEKKIQKLKVGDDCHTEKPGMKEKGNDEFTEETGAEIKKDADEKVTYFTFITDAYFAEASWPEIIAANGSRKRLPGLGKTPFGIERVVGARVERTYTMEEIRAGCIETEEALWWEKQNGRRADKEEWNEKEERMVATGAE